MSGRNPKTTYLSEEGSQGIENADILLAERDWTPEEETKVKRKYEYC